MTVIVQVVQHLQPGGIETMVLDLLQHPGPGHIVYAISLDGTKDDLIAAWPRLKPVADRLHALGKPPGLTPRLIPNLAALLRGLKADAVHTHHIGPLIYGGLAARLAGVRRVVHTEHDAWHLAMPKRRAVEGLLLRLVRPNVVADAGIVARALSQAFPRQPTQIIYNGIDTARFHPGDRDAARRALGLPLDQPIIGCAARLERVKGVDALIEGFALVPPPAILALAGTGGEAAALAAQVAELGLSHRVRFLGRIDDMPQFYQALDLFCLASRAEGLPLSLLEAQASGVRVVATDVGGVGDAVCPQSGILVRGGDATALAAALNRALSRAESTDPRSFVVAERDIIAMARAYDRLYAA